MKKYNMTCSCGHMMEVEAKSREDAVAKMKDMMTEEAVKSHMKEKHPGEPVMSAKEYHAMIEKDLVEA